MEHAVPVVLLPSPLPAVRLLTPMPGATGLPLPPSAASLQVTTLLLSPMPITVRLPAPFPFLKPGDLLFPAAELPFHVTAVIMVRLPSPFPVVLLLTPMHGVTELPLPPSPAWLPETTP